MKKTRIFLYLFLLALHPNISVSGSSQYHKNTRHFFLHFVTVGFGSNRFIMQPVFKVEGTKFIYTSEQVWTIGEQTQRKKDTLLTGFFRVSSSDSISNLINELKDSVVY